MTDYVYRVVDEHDEPYRKHSYQKGQHFYPKKATAQGVATSANTAEETRSRNPFLPREQKNYRVQQAAIVWEEVDNG